MAIDSEERMCRALAMLMTSLLELQQAINNADELFTAAELTAEDKFHQAGVEYQLALRKYIDERVAEGIERKGCKCRRKWFFGPR